MAGTIKGVLTGWVDRAGGQGVMKCLALALALRLMAGTMANESSGASPSSVISAENFFPSDTCQFWPAFGPVR